MTGSTEGVWLHAVVPHIDPATLDGVPGMDGVRLSVVRAAGLTAVVSKVPLSRYGEEPMLRNLEDLTWLESAARAHHVVVDALSRVGPVVPARLATVYLDPDGVATLLTDRRDDFVDGLDRVAGRAEWGVKAYAMESVTETPGAAESGTAYLRKRRAQLTAHSEGLENAAREASAVHATLAHFAAGARRHAPQDRRLSGAETAMVLNGAYLVDQDRVTEFTELVSALSKCHAAVRIELTGPWPPYSFIAGETS
ncbi:GvpL/GvpF family gas vesicle protein [Actinoplanes sp. TBRC 11911]|uniref:GvpL/GvpF family gas vesicle protein n=1 Tax=Actinoplanes sp. TBRC 11911 TaxID=2729386 RepID=UPI00145EA753|nr:GvpL/GvpF family gas vesicle protein [Actinoplanes sp. TBRC 11911]NMO50728.1 GvpL/GvpF family gas vesicle protein [Actinoplanes sp. TBRC 11911]